jgi:single-strand DNA-binding protein
MFIYRLKFVSHYNFATRTIRQPDVRNYKLKKQYHEKFKKSSSVNWKIGCRPELNEFSTGSKKVQMRIATSETYKNKSGEKVTDTQWHNVVAWNSTADFASAYLNKGTEVMIHGKLVNRSYEDKNGSKRYITEVVTDQMLILQKKEALA